MPISSMSFSPAASETMSSTVFFTAAGSIIQHALCVDECLLHVVALRSARRESLEPEAAFQDHSFAVWRWWDA